MIIISQPKRTRYISLDLATQNKPALREIAQKAERNFGDRKEQLERAKMRIVAASNFGIINLEKAENDENSIHRLGFETALHGDITEAPEINEMAKRAIYFFRLLRERDETGYWRDKQKLAEYADVFIAACIRMVDALLLPENTGIDQRIKRISTLADQSADSHIVAKDPISLERNVAVATAIFYAPLAELIETSLQTALINSAVASLHPRAYGIIQKEMERKIVVLERTKNTLLQILKKVNKMEEGWEARVKSTASIVLKLIYNNGLTDETVQPFHLNRFPDIVAARIFVREESVERFGSDEIDISAFAYPYSIDLQSYARYILGRAYGKINARIPKVDYGNDGLSILHLLYRPYKKDTKTPRFELQFVPAHLKEEYFFGEYSHAVYKSKRIPGMIGEPTIPLSFVQALKRYLEER